MSGLALECAARSDVGRRSNNEDALYVSPRVVAVADGVGGQAAGEIASSWAIQAITKLDNSRLGKPLEAALADVVAWGNETIGFVSECRPHTAGMSTTLTAVALTDDGTYVVANIGDSRTYLLRDGALTQLTRDDSFVQYMVDGGHLTLEQARRHPSRSLVMEALDGRPERRPSTETLAGRAGDRLLLCSDGLSDVLDHETLASLLAGPAAEAADRLVDAALRAGGRDNVTVIVADVIARSEPGPIWLPPL